MLLRRASNSRALVHLTRVSHRRKLSVSTPQTAVKEVLKEHPVYAPMPPGSMPGMHVLVSATERTDQATTAETAASKIKSKLKEVKIYRCETEGGHSPCVRSK